MLGILRKVRRIDNCFVSEDAYDSGGKFSGSSPLEFDFAWRRCLDDGGGLPQCILMLRFSSTRKNQRYSRPLVFHFFIFSPMLRPRKKYTVYELQRLKGRQVLTHIHVKSPEEATAAEEAGVDLMSCSFDSPETQARLPELVAAAPTSFLSCATPHGMASAEEAIRISFSALELGASSVYCSGSPFLIEAMAREGIPVVGHLGLVPRHVTWTGYRAIGKTSEEAEKLYQQMKELESAGAYAAELEVVPHRLATFLSSETSMLLMSLGSGSGCDTQFLFSDDLLGDYEERLPRHARAYRDFAAEKRRLQEERISAFREYIADVKRETFPATENLVEMDEAEFQKFLDSH